MNTSYLREVEELLSESPDSAALRERTSFSRQLRSGDGSVVLFGAGRLGQLCARALRRGGVLLHAFCDGNSRLEGEIRDGVAVISPKEAARRFGSSLFIVAIWTGTSGESMRDRIAYLKSLGCLNVVSHASLVWAHGREEIPFHAFDLPSKILAEAPLLRQVAARLSDAESLRVLIGALRQRLHGDYTDVPPFPDQYFPAPVVELGNHEVFVDGGAYDGDTLAEFVRRSGTKFAWYHAFEPDSGNLERLRQRVSSLASDIRNKISVHEAALHAENALLSFSDQGGQTSRLNTKGAVQVRGLALDTILADAAVSFLKLDVEGAELSALQGAVGILTRRRPLVAACIYHGPSDLWTIPLLILRYIPESELFFRQHGVDGWEMVCYVVPKERGASVLRNA